MDVPSHTPLAALTHAILQLRLHISHVCTQEALQAQREREAAEEAGARDDLAARLAELRTRRKEQRQLAEAA